MIPAKFYEGAFRNPIIGNARTIHGSRYLPPGYTIAFLPSNVEFETRCQEDGLSDVSISSSYNIVKALVAIIQVVLASTTLYKTRGDQIERYGYAAFGLTVLPYIIMSIINLIGNLLTPDFATLYLVRSPEMTEAEDPRRNGWFDGVVGEVKNSPDENGIGIRFEEVEGGILLHVDAEHEVQDHISIVHVRDETYSTVDADHNRAEHSRLDPDQELSSTELRRLLSETPCIISDEGHTRLPPHDPSQVIRNCGAIRAHNSYVRSNDAFTPSLNLNIPAASNFVYSKSQVWGTRRVVVWHYVAVFMISVPLIVIGILTRFKNGNSTTPQRIWIMGWLLFATVAGVLYGQTALNSGQTETVLDEDIESLLTASLHAWGMKHWMENKVSPPTELKSLIFRWYTRISTMSLYGVFAIGGLVVVGQMLGEYGTCSKLS